MHQRGHVNAGSGSGHLGKRLQIKARIEISRCMAGGGVGGIVGPGGGWGCGIKYGMVLKVLAFSLAIAGCSCKWAAPAGASDAWAIDAIGMGRGAGNGAATTWVVG